ncbi:MAG: hypothetical protein K9J37_16725 [Saprospiraceae bacterium]|nr:hypothetical protein [Saprospiraceae bacterium]MCF8251560.1 hypothetical protein [Saprospiraceae bacterium]MCF8310930.1 hypothetical protein [Saprospiraceae bacterium]MCF8439734.1 hypothetical protein [Saprospiraceae bacterium]
MTFHAMVVVTVVAAFGIAAGDPLRSVSRHVITQYVDRSSSTMPKAATTRTTTVM